MILTDVLKKINRGIAANTSSIRLFSQQNLLSRYNHLNNNQSSKQNSPSSTQLQDETISEQDDKANSNSINRLDEEPICRICRLTKDKSREPLLSPCTCRGTLAYIHRTCLEKWLKRSGTTYCELCRFQYTIQVVERFSKIESFRKWLADEDNIDDVQDLVVDGVLTVTFLPIVLICCYGFLAVYSETPNFNAYNLSKSTFEIKQKLWVIFMLGCVTMSIVASYSCWLALRAVHYQRKWTNWVRRHGNLTLILNTRKEH